MQCTLHCGWHRKDGLANLAPMMFRFPCSRPLAIFSLLLSASTFGATPADPFALARAEFQKAYAQPDSSPAADSAQLRSYVLYPYLQASRLSNSLRAARTSIPSELDNEVAQFLRANQGQPVAQDLRRSWLFTLAERKEWAPFQEFHDAASDDAALRCHGLTARIETGQAGGVAADATRAWLTPRSVPECDRAFEHLRGAGALDTSLIEQRVTLALQENNASFARQLAQQLPPDRAAPLLQWASLLENPKREIDALIASPRTAVDKPALLAGWARLARADRAAGKERFEPLMKSRGFDARAASPFALALALPVSWDRDRDALGWFARVDAADFDDTAREWQARAALWAGDWQQAGASIEAMTPATRNATRWRYWAARVAAQLGDDARARQLFEAVLPDDNHYSASAAARLGRKLTPNAKAHPVDAAQLARVEKEAPIVRARELRASGLLRDAMAEWRFGQAALQPAALAQAVHLAARWGWYDQAITTATAARIFNDYRLLYPRPYDPQVANAAKLSGLEPELIYGVLRQESLYRNDAVSTARARGLMQLLLDTARRTARAFKLPPPTELSLTDPAVNVTIGAAHVKELLDRFGNQIPVALAGYNAGPNAAQRWLPDEPKDPDIWIENIPFNETRGYVQRILWHRIVFSWLRSGEPQDTRALLAPINPRS
jgi:soluble lytic murein transglycosylase